jgi:carboxyl-terminal processing protease
MKKLLNLFFILSIIVISASGYTGEKDSLSYPDLKPDNIHHRVDQAIKFALMKYHYKDIDLDDSLSSKMFDNYIERLDFNRSYFLKSDIESFEKYRYSLDDAINSGNLDFAFNVYHVFQQRFAERIEFIDKQIEKGFDFSIDEFYRPDRSEEPWAETTAQLDSIWRKRLKDEALRMKLAGKEWDKIRETLQKRYDNYNRNMGKSQSEDVFQYYMNVFTQMYDPHTNYMSPKLSDDFRIRMSQSLEGIGASLRTENEYTKVVEVIPGGPADKSGLLDANDLITGVGQGENGEMVDVIGWRIDDVVQLIRGPKSTTVRLQIIPADAPLDEPAHTISIVRDKVKLSDQVAKGDVIDIEEAGKNYKIGVIEIPSFYFDYDGMRKGDTSFASTSRDVKRILNNMKSQNVDGVLIDLRDNGGGFLNEAIDLTGLFIDLGPVVQVRNANGAIDVERDDDPSITYSGPLAVLVNNFSASASEIFAAAIQDYGRGIILGNQSFGKGTVQNIIKLGNFFPRSKEKYGQLKLTIAKFYRISGGSTQHVGVIPDVSFPSRFNHDEVGESSQDNALLWDEIDPVNYHEVNDNLLPVIRKLNEMHKARVQSDVKFRNLLEEIKEHEERDDKELISLNESVRKKIRDEAKARKEVRQERLADNNEDKKEDEDLFMVESARILGDWIRLGVKNN